MVARYADGPTGGPLDGKHGGEENSGLYENGFERDAAVAVHNVLTAKAVEHILLQLGQTNFVQCNWLNNFAADNTPFAGDKFVTKLMMEKRQSVRNATNGSVCEINPQTLGNRVLMMREELAKNVTPLVPKEVKRRNMDVLRKHLERTSYTSGEVSSPTQVRAAQIAAERRGGGGTGERTSFRPGRSRGKR